MRFPYIVVCILFFLITLNGHAAQANALTPIHGGIGISKVAYNSPLSQPLLRIIDSVKPASMPVIDDLTEKNISVQKRSPVPRDRILQTIQPMIPALWAMTQTINDFPRKLAVTITVRADGIPVTVTCSDSGSFPVFTTAVQKFFFERTFSLKEEVTFTVSFSFRDSGTDGKIQGLPVDSLDMVARVAGSMLEVVTTMVFSNKENRPLEGELILPLPTGATMSGYALDINGHMVDGVAIEKERAKVIFETEKRKKVDPGLVEWVDGNIFRTRIYPVPASGTRMVQVRAVMPLSHSNREFIWRLPQVQVKTYSIRSLDSKGNSLTLLSSRDTLVPGTVVFDLSSRPHVESVTGYFNDTLWFSDVPNLSLSTETRAVSPLRLRIYWDCSSSRNPSAAVKELAALKEMLFAWKGSLTSVTAITFAHAPLDTLNFATVTSATISRLDKWLSGHTFDGGTALPSLDTVQDADIVLLFSDGRETFSKWNVTRAAPSAPVWAVTAQPSEISWNVYRLALQSHGRVVDVTQPQRYDSINQPPVLSSIEVKSGEVADLLPCAPSLWTENTALRGKLLSKSAHIILHFNLSGAKTVSHEITVRKEDDLGPIIARAWAQEQLAIMLGQGLGESDEVRDLGLRFGIVTPRTSLLVLETLGQYVQHKVRPPVTWPEMRTQYDASASINTEAPKTGVAVLEGISTGLHNEWFQKCKWYDNNINDKNIGKSETRQDSSSHALRSRKFENAQVVGYLDNPTPAYILDTDSQADQRSGPVNEEEAYKRALGDTQRHERMSSRVQSSARTDEIDNELETLKKQLESEPLSPPQETRHENKVKAKEVASRSPGSFADDTPLQLTLTAWNPDTPYLKKIAAASRENQWTTYTKEKKNYAMAPSFYADCAGHFFLAGQKDLGVRVLSNLTELFGDDTPILRIAAYSLSRQGLHAWSLPIFQKIRDLAGSEPQNWRDLALELSYAAQADSVNAGRFTQESHDLLTYIALHHWPRFNELKEIVLTERNSQKTLLAAHQKTIQPTDTLQKEMPVDIRILLTWDSDESDMDLMITEPDGDVVMYNSRFGTTGSRLSCDFTRGFGPEEYMLPKAKPGEYRIKVKFYGAQTTKLLGAVTVRTDVFSNYGRPEQTHDILTFRLGGANEVVEVGRLMVGQDGKVQVLGVK